MILHKSDSRRLPATPEPPEEKYEYWGSVERRYRPNVIYILGYDDPTFIAANSSRVELNPPSHQKLVTCHICVLNAHRLHQRSCSKSTPEEPRCLCKPPLSYRLYDRSDVEEFRRHLKIYHLEYFERFHALMQKRSLQKRATTQFETDVWQVQKLIRDVHGIGDDLS